VPRTGVIGPFRIVSESALAAGIRRIEAITSVEAERMINEKLGQAGCPQRLVEEPFGHREQAVEKLVEQHASMGKELEKFAKEKVKGSPPHCPRTPSPTAKG
jgi:alanyl-tRNA synthetase